MDLLTGGVDPGGLPGTAEPDFMLSRGSNWAVLTPMDGWSATLNLMDPTPRLAGVRTPARRETHWGLG